MTLGSDSDRRLIGLCVAALSATLLVHALLLPRYLPDSFTRAVPFLALGWGSYLLLFYSLGRLRPQTDGMPNMRTTDLGVALFLFAIVVSGLLDTAGLTFEGAPSVHLIPAVGVYVGLALAGWGFGTRTQTVNRIAAETE